MAKRSKITRDLCSPKYRQRVVPNKKKAQAKEACQLKIAKQVMERDYDMLEELSNA